MDRHVSDADPRRGARQPMYGAFYGLSEPPFDLTPDPRFLFLTPRQREALGNLQYGLSTSRGFTMLVGDAGTGKTTLVRAALSTLSDSSSRYVLISNPTLERAEFYEFLTRAFGLSDAALHSKTTFLAELQQDVEARFAAGGLTGIIIDEAQSLPSALLEEIRLLGNIETTSTKLLNIVLAGQPELATRLNEPSLRQLKQRVTLRCELSALSLDETAAYIAGRVRIAGGVPEHVFAHGAVTAIHRGSAGIPRTINVLCDNALISGFALGVKPIHAQIIQDVCRDFDLAVAPAVVVEASAPAPAPVAPSIALDPVVPPSPPAVADVTPPPAPAPPAVAHKRIAPTRVVVKPVEELRLKPADSGPATPEPAMFGSQAARKPRFSFFSKLLGS